MFCVYCFKFFSDKYWKGIVLPSCFNFRSFWIVLISFLLNIGNKMCYFCFNFCFFFVFLFFVCVFFIIFIFFIIYFYFRPVLVYCFGFFSSKHGQKTKPRNRMENKTCRFNDLLRIFLLLFLFIYLFFFSI